MVQFALDKVNAEGSFKGEPLARDGGWGWVIVFASFVIHVIGEMMNNYIFI